MAFEPPEIEEIIARIKTYIKEVLGDLNPTEQNSFIYSLIVAMANLSNDNNLQLKLDIIPNSFALTCKTEEALEPFATVRSINKNLATISTGKAVISGLTGTIIPINTKFIANNIIYNTQSTIEIDTNTIDIYEITANGKTVTVKTRSNHDLASNIVVTISGCSTSTFNGQFPILVTGLDTFTYNIEQVTTATENIGNVTSTTGILNFKSQTAGADTNLDNGDSLAISNSIAGADNNAFVMFSGISGGTDDESFLSWKERVVYRYQNPITYFNKANIITTAKKVEGVTRVWVYECTPDVGQVTIYLSEIMIQI